MSLNFKNTALFILIFCGFLFFLVNAIELNSNNKNIKITSSIKSSKNISNLKEILKKTQVKEDNLIKKFSENDNKTKIKEIIIIVKKDQTF